eukprot:6370389-Pyramimonas_sp.AAC.1
MSETPRRSPNSDMALSVDTSSRFTQIGKSSSGVLARMAATSARCAHKSASLHASTGSWDEKSPA